MTHVLPKQSVNTRGIHNNDSERGIINIRDCSSSEVFFSSALRNKVSLLLLTAWLMWNK